MVGNLIGSRAAQEQAVVGETPNLAARLQAAAVPSAIAIDQTTRRLLVRSGPPGPPRQAIDDRLPVATIRDATSWRTSRFPPTTSASGYDARDPALLGAAPNRKAPATADKIAAMARVVGERLSEIGDRALLLIGFAGAFRRSELVALDVEDVEEVPEGLRVTIRRSKTDQEGQGAVSPSRAGQSRVRWRRSRPGSEPPALPPDRCSGRSPRASDCRMRGSPIAASPRS
jgi:integrase